MSETADKTMILTTAEVAEQVGTEPKNLRKFFRSSACDITPVGQGKRYAITEAEIPALKEAFHAWAGGKKKANDEETEPKADKAPKKNSRKKKADPEPAAEEDFDEDLEPTDEDIIALDDEDLEL